MQIDTYSAKARKGISVRSRKALLVLYIAAVALFWASLYLYVPTLPVYAKTKVDNLALIGIILSMYGLWQAIIRLPLGMAADWLGWRKPFIVGGFILAGIGAWVMGTATSGTGIGVGRAITGLSAGTWVPLTVVFSSLFPPGEAVRATALLSATNSLARMVASGLNGWMNGIGGYSLAFFAAVATAILAILVVLPAEEKRRTPEKTSFQETMKLISRPDVLRPSVLAGLVQYVTWAATLSFTPILASRMGANDFVVSILTASSIGIESLGNFSTALFTSRFGNRVLVTLSFVFLSLGAIVAAFSPSIKWLFVAQFIISFGSGIAFPLLMGLSIAHVEGKQRATAMGLHQAIYGMGMFVGPFISGWIARWMGIQPMFGFTGLLCLVLGLVGVRWLVAIGI
jgi:MFS family permease